MAAGALALGLGGCKATGGGFIPSATGADAAHFGFVMQTNKQSNVVSGSYHDGYVKFRLDGGTVGQPSPCANWTVDYVSTSRDYPGSGTVLISVCDNGEPGPTNGDSLSVTVQSGPYAGYTDSGNLQGGNLQVNQGKNDDGYAPAHARRHHHRR